MQRGSACPKGSCPRYPPPRARALSNGQDAGFPSLKWGFDSPRPLSRGAPPAAVDVRRQRSEQPPHGLDLVLERLLAVAALVELEHAVDPRDPELEGDGVEFGDDGEDVLRRALERGAHGVEEVADAVLALEAALDLCDVAGGARVRAAQRDDGQVGGRHRRRSTRPDRYRSAGSRRRS